MIDIAVCYDAISTMKPVFSLNVSEIVYLKRYSLFKIRRFKKNAFFDE